MKKCTYCGKIVPDESAVCPIDGKPLVEKNYFVEETRHTKSCWATFEEVIQKRNEGVLRDDFPVRVTVNGEYEWTTVGQICQLAATQPQLTANPPIAFTKKCSYCGTEAPDEAKVCPIDGYPFGLPKAAKATKPEPQNATKPKLLTRGQYLVRFLIYMALVVILFVIIDFQDIFGDSHKLDDQNHVDESLVLFETIILLLNIAKTFIMDVPRCRDSGISPNWAYAVMAIAVLSKIPSPSLIGLCYLVALLIGFPLQMALFFKRSYYDLGVTSKGPQTAEEIRQAEQAAAKFQEICAQEDPVAKWAREQGKGS